MDIFDSIVKSEGDSIRPLADLLRPKNLDEFIGQEHLLGKNSVLRKIILEDKLCSMILWGPPGSGKTSLAAVFSHMSNADMVSLSAVTSGVKDVKETIDMAIAESGVDHAYVRHRPRLLSDNGPCYISGELKSYLADNGLTHTRGQPFHPMTQGKIERYHRVWVRPLSAR